MFDGNHDGRTLFPHPTQRALNVEIFAFVMGSVAAVTFAANVLAVAVAAFVAAAAAETTGVVPAVRPVAAAASACVKEKPEG